MQNPPHRPQYEYQTGCKRDDGFHTLCFLQMAGWPRARRAGGYAAAEQRPCGSHPGRCRWTPVGGVVDQRHGLAGVALLHQVARGAFAAPALGSNAQLELDFIKVHARVCMTRNLTIGNSAADTDDHGLASRLAG